MPPWGLRLGSACVSGGRADCCKQRAHGRQPGAGDFESCLFAPAHVMPSRQSAHGGASAGAGDLIGPLVKLLGELGQARSPIEQSQQHAQLGGGQPASLDQFQYAVERGLHNGSARSIASVRVTVGTQLR